VVARIGMPAVYQPYGMTECQALCLLHDLDEPFDLRIRSGINPVPRLEVRVVDPETGAPCPANREGELQFRGECVTRGHYKARGDGRCDSPPTLVPHRRPRGAGRRRPHLLRPAARDPPHQSSHGGAWQIEAFDVPPAVEQAFVVGVPDPGTNEAPVAT
jgi:acyl-CoA synthetase (AMP-forming)/AMP-acid ligase II